MTGEATDVTGAADVTGVAEPSRASRPDGTSGESAQDGSLVGVKTFDDLFQ